VPIKSILTSTLDSGTKFLQGTTFNATASSTMGWTGRTAVLCRGPCGRILNNAKENHDDRGNLAADLQVLPLCVSSRGAEVTSQKSSQVGQVMQILKEHARPEQWDKLHEYA
jgi:hypothetical protein